MRNSKIAILLISTFMMLCACEKNNNQEDLKYLIHDSVVFTANIKSYDFTIFNDGSSKIYYKLSQSDDYFEFPLVSGELDVGSSSTVTVNINRENLESGTSFSRIFLTINDIIDIIDVRIENFIGQKQILTTDVIDAEYSKISNELVYVTNNHSLYIYNTESKVTDNIQLSFLPTCISILADGSKAIVGHDGHVTYVNIQLKQIINTYTVSCNTFDIVLGTNEWAYVFPYWYQWADVISIDLSQTTSNGITYNGVHTADRYSAKLHPSGKYIYAADIGIIPSDIDKFDIQNGAIQYLYDSPYHGDYSVSGDLWFSEDGSQIFTKAGNVFRTSEIEYQDIQYDGTIERNPSIEYSGIVGIDHIELKKHLYIIASDNNWYSGEIEPFISVINSDNLSFKYQLGLEKYLVPDSFEVGIFTPAIPRFIFANSNGKEIYVLTTSKYLGLDSKWAIQTIKID